MSCQTQCSNYITSIKRKTTTIVEAVYQLGRLHTYNSTQPKLKILLVAPSNDATDILVEKLSPYFPPSEMMRVLSYTRSIDQVSLQVRPYVREGLQAHQLVSEILSVQIVVTTVSLAARLFCTGGGVPKGFFDVLCVDEAGHATEPEVIGATANLMEFSGKTTGQMVLAGDPNQLGPVITSDLCKKYGLGTSFMERLIKTSPAYCLDDNDAYPPQLVALLVRNYRSHPAILKLPNEMFYENKLIACGDRMMTHSMTKWEHLPNRSAGFPIVFKAVDGENEREGTSPSWFNPQEAISVVETVELLVKHSRPAIGQDEIGIITPYARQVQKIRLLLKVKDMGDIKVGSVETFQGQERRCIVISTVRSENDLLEHDKKYNLGFVANEKRFNVAVTRAKALLVVVGNPRVLQTDKKNWLPLLRYCRDNDSWMGEEWDEAAAVEGEGGDGMEMLRQAGDDDDEGSEGEDGWEVVTDQEAVGFINREE
jgi:helicase MOV-10